MDRTYWHRQTVDKPLFPDLLWSRPENRAHAGKILIVGGNAHGFSAPAEAYAEAVKAGIGSSRVLLPDSLQKTVGKVFAAGEYGPSTPSGSFGQNTLAEILDLSNWADAVLLAGDFGRNSETAILLEQFSIKYSGQLTITQDAADYFVKLPGILSREQTLLVMNFAQLQKIATSAKFPQAFTSSMDFIHLVEALHEFSLQHQPALIVGHEGTIYTAFDGQVSTTKLYDPEIIIAAHAAVWWLQNSTKIFEALTTSLIKK